MYSNPVKLKVLSIDYNLLYQKALNSFQFQTKNNPLGNNFDDYSKKKISDINTS